MGRKKRENYHRCSVLIVENSRESVVCLFEFCLSKNNTTYEEFLNQHSHDIYHLCYHQKECCQCQRVPRGKNVINISQLEQLYEKYGPKMDGHKRKGASEHCCSKAIPNITMDTLDVTFCRCLLENFCDDIFWHSCLTAENISLDAFLNKNKHTLYHMWKGSNGNCCLCSSGQKHNTRINDQQWNTLFKKSEDPCSRHGGKKDPICSMSAREGLEIHSVDKNLSKAVLAECCPLKRRVNHLVEIRNDHAHKIKASLTNDEFIKTSKCIEDDILFIGRVCGKEEEFKAKFKETQEQTLDMDVCHRYQDKLVEEIKKNQEEILFTLKEREQPRDKDSDERRKQQELTRAEVQTYIKEGTFVKTDVITGGMSLLRSEGIVVLTGAAGSGKTRNGLEMMRIFVNQNDDYDIIKLSSLSEWKNWISINDKLVILFEDIFGKTNSRFNEDTDSRLLDELYASVNRGGNNKVIITIRDTIRNSCEQLFQKQRILNDRLTLDLNSEKFQMKSDEKLICLRNYFKVTNIEVTNCEENYKDKAIENKIVTVKINEETLRTIVQMKTAIGFPQAVYLFTGNRTFTRQGPEFFKDACNCLTSEITELRRIGRKDEIIRWQYITLVYTMLTEGDLRPKDIDRSLVEEILKSLYKKDLPDEFQELIRSSAKSLTGKYLSNKSGETHTAYTFQHQTTFEAVLVSYGEKEPASVIPFMSFEFITEIVRPYHYKPNPGETVLKIPHRHQDLLAKRLVEIMLTEYGTRKEEFVQAICKAEILRLTEEELAASMINDYESKMESRPSHTNLRFFSDKKPYSRSKHKSPGFHFPSAILQNIISYQDNDHVVETLIDNISKTYQENTRPETKEVCRHALINVLEQTCSGGTAHRLKVIYSCALSNNIPFDVNRCMEFACCSRNIKCATWLREETTKGASSLNEVILEASRNNDVELVDWLLDNFDESDLSLNEAIRQAYNKGHYDLVRNLIDCVDDIKNLELKYILTKACRDGQKDLVEHLLSNVEHQHFDLAYSFNETCKRGKLKIVKLMLNKVENINKLDMKSALNCATQCGWKDLVEWLIDNNDQSLFDLRECLKIAIKYGRIELKDWLQKEKSLNPDKDILKEAGLYFGQKY